MNDNCNSKNEMLAKRLKSLTTKVSALEKNFENYRDLYFSEAIDRALWELECDAAFMLERLNVEYNKRKPSKGEYCVRKPMP